VNYSVSGTATPGVDYAALPGSVTLPAGVLATNIFISPLGNNLTTNQASVTLNLTASVNFVLSSLANATAVILDRPVNNWLRANFSAAQLTNTLVSGDSADPANDGLPNLMKYVLGLNPNTADVNPFVPVFTNGIFGLSYPLSKAAVDAVMTPEWSTNLQNWQAGTGFQIVNVTDQITNQIITIRATTPAASGFFRFRVTRL